MCTKWSIARTLREMQVVVTRFNQWVRNVLGELHMLSTAEKDLEALIGPPAAADLLVRQQVAQPALITHFMHYIRHNVSGMLQ